MEKLLTFQNQQCIFNSEKNEIYLVIREAFYLAGEKYKWEELKIENPIGVGINRRLLKFAIHKQASFRIKIMKPINRPDAVPTTLMLTFPEYLNFLKKVDSLNLPYPEWSQKHSIQLIIFPVQIMI